MRKRPEDESLRGVFLSDGEHPTTGGRNAARNVGGLRKSERLPDKKPEA